MVINSPRLIYRLGAFLLAAVLSVLIFTQTSEAAEDPIQVFVDRHQIDFSVDPYLEQGTTLVQLRPLFESLGIELEWDEESKTVNGSKGEEQFSLTIGENTASVNGQTLTLDVSGRLINNHTLVPLRFVGEATGSAVGWNGASRTIQVYSKEFMQILEISMEEAQQAVTAEPSVQEPVGQNTLQGFYARGYADLLGIHHCSGMCWDYYYFFNDHQYITSPPPAGGVNCEVQTCLEYEVSGDQIIMNGNSRRFELTESGMMLSGNHFFRHDPMLRPKLDGTYVANSYTQLLLGGSFATTSTFVFHPDGTFLDDRFIGVITDGSETGDGSGVSSTHLGESESAGRYTVINHHILLEYHDGATEQLIFFRPDLNDRMYKIGGRDFLFSEGPLELDEEYEQRKQEESIITDPLPDNLLNEGLADKTVIRQSNPEDSDWWGNIEIQLHRYQWAELDIKPEHQDRFTDFGDGTITALTAQYTIVNEGEDTLDLSTLTSTILLSDAIVDDFPALSPSPSDELLEAGESVERTVVFLFPSDFLKQYNRFELLFSDVETIGGHQPLYGMDLEFRLVSPY